MNDSALLQHSCEIAAMHAVVRASNLGRFHLYCTHAGPPSHAWDADAASRSQLTRTINLAAAQNKSLPQGTKLHRSPLIDVYGRLRASPTSIPNTPRILSNEAATKGASLSAVLIDSDGSVAQALREEFEPPAFRVFQGDWRKPLARLRSYDAPWLLSVAPNKFSKTRAIGGINATDIQNVADHVNRELFARCHLGVVCFLGRGLDTQGREGFWEAMVDAFGDLPLEFVAVQGTKQRRHVAGLVCSDGGVLAEAALAVCESLETVDPV